MSWSLFTSRNLLFGLPAPDSAAACSSHSNLNIIKNQSEHQPERHPTSTQNISKTSYTLQQYSSSLLNMAARQPNAAALAAAFATVSHEISLVPNLPTFNNGQNILAAIQAMNTNLTANINTMRTDLTTLTATVTTIRTDLTTLTATVDALNLRFDDLELRMRAESAYFSPFSNFIIITFYSSLNHTARVYNSHISNRNIPLRVLHDHRNTAVAGFPIDPASLMRLQGQTKSHIEELFH